MRLRVSTPVEVIEDADDVAHVRAEDETGAFGILPGHADFVTVLTPSVVTWRDREGREGFVLVRGGVLSVEDGALVEIATRQAVREDEIGALGEAARVFAARDAVEERESQTAVRRLHFATMRQIRRVLDAARGASSGAAVMGEDAEAAEEDGS